MTMVVVMLTMLMKVDDVDDNHDDYAGLLECVFVSQKSVLHTQNKDSIYAMHLCYNLYIIQSKPYNLCIIQSKPTT